MPRIAALALMVVASASSSASMMGGPMTTSPYFPLIDGARYDYVIVGGSRASATAVMHAGQRWSGVSQLTSVNMTFACRSGTPCAQHATEFYRMDADGLHYFGGDGDTAAGDHFMMTYASPEWMLKNPVWPGTMMGPGHQQGAESWEAAVNAMHSTMGPQSYTSSYRAEALETVTTPMGTFTNALHVRESRGSGTVRDVWYAQGVGMVRWIQGDEEALLASLTMPTGPAPAVTRAIEYYHAGLGHYFMTTDAAEIDALDSGRIHGWQRTGLSFNVVDPGADTRGMAAQVCRYYGSPEYGLNTHFYAASPEECAAVQRQWPDRWLLESSNVFRVYIPDTATGACPAGTLPVYRTWNQRPDTNHRYTIDARVQTMMMARGHAPEGNGDPAVAMCAPQ